MAAINISLPDTVKNWIEAQAQTGGYSNATDYVRDLIRRDQKRADKLAELQRLITEGVENGVSGWSMTEVLEIARTQAVAVPRR